LSPVLEKHTITSSLFVNIAPVPPARYVMFISYQVVLSVIVLMAYNAKTAGVNTSDILTYPGMVLVPAAILAMNGVMSSALTSVSLMYNAVDKLTLALSRRRNPAVGSAAVVLLEYV